MSSQGAINADKEQPMSTKYAIRTRSQTRGPNLIWWRLMKIFFLDDGDLWTEEVKKPKHLIRHY
jgi:hypothetical protein